MPRGVYDRSKAKPRTKYKSGEAHTMSDPPSPTPEPISTFDYPIERLPSDRATVIVQERHGQYGPPEWIYENVAKMWNIWLSIQDTEEVIRPIDASDVAIMQLLLKVCREQSSELEDNVVDMAGYANVYHMIKEAR